MEMGPEYPLPNLMSQIFFETTCTNEAIGTDFKIISQRISNIN